MIDEKKLMEEIRNLKKHYDFFYKKDKSEIGDIVKNASDTLFYDIAKIIYGQPKVGEWIPCSERLPDKEYDTVLVFLDTNIFDIAVWHSQHGFRPWYAAHYESSPPEWDGNVIAWQPLPEPWKGEE